MTFGQQVHACYSLPEWQAVKLIYLRRKIYDMAFQWVYLSMCIINFWLFLHRKCTLIGSKLLAVRQFSFKLTILPIVPCEQRLHFRGMSWRAKSSLCRQSFKSVQKSGRKNLKKGFLPVLGRFRTLRESCVSEWTLTIIAPSCIPSRQILAYERG